MVKYGKNKEVLSMNRNMVKRLAAVISKMAFLIALVSVNTTCIHKYYQEELDEQLDSLRKYSIEENH